MIFSKRYVPCICFNSTKLEQGCYEVKLHLWFSKYSFVCSVYRFVPKENGVHYIDVKLNDTHVPDSPFAIMVGSVAADPAMVHAYGEGLEAAKCSKYTNFISSEIKAL